VLLLRLPTAQAGTVSITLEDLGNALQLANENPYAVNRLVLDTIQSQLDRTQLQFQQGDILYQQHISEQVIQGGCSSTLLNHMDTNVRIQANTSVSLLLESLSDPVTITLDLRTRIEASGRVQQTFGFRFNGCHRVGRDSFEFDAGGPLHISIQLTLQMHPEFITPTTLRLQPEISITGQLESWRINVDVDGSLLRSQLEHQLEREIEGAFSPGRIRAELDKLQASANARLADIAPGGFLDIQFPEPDANQVIALHRLLSADSRFTLTLDYVNRHRNELLVAMLMDDQDAIDSLLGNAAACEAAAALQLPLPHLPLAAHLATGCSLTQVNDAAPPYYSDSRCLDTVDFIDTDMTDYCDVVLDEGRLGNAAADVTTLNLWSLSPGTRLNISALPIDGNNQPFTQRLNYKTVQTEYGECQLEMRVYSMHPGVSGQRPLIALHGGSWQQRASGFIGIEATASHFVNTGFVVFAPFYRLIGSEDGNAECNNAGIEEILADASDALDWVQANSQRFGANGKPVVFGQSAGGHLAASLAVNRADEIDRAVLFYAPTDFRDFADQIQRGTYSGSQGRRIMQAVTGENIDEVDLNSPLIAANSFPAIIARQPGSYYPPMFILHGEADALLPHRQSVRMCNALAGNAESGPASLEYNLTSLRKITQCGTWGSELHLIAEGEHALDICAGEELCNAGSAESVATVADSMQRMLHWIVAPH
jgi:acetyl esterase/lipase